MPMTMGVVVDTIRNRNVIAVITMSMHAAAADITTTMSMHAAAVDITMTMVTRAAAIVTITSITARRRKRLAG